MNLSKTNNLVFKQTFFLYLNYTRIAYKTYVCISYYYITNLKPI